MGKALYRKYRSKNLSEVIGQSHITDSLTQAIKKDRISHAYLFTGPRGVGKTSIARILAHQINNLPYEGNETNHLDIIEIDAASNRRIDEIRELKSRVHVAPAQAKYKVYIIDEVHMLTKEAFNALLKTLEEPPKHAVFILATTDAHKLPETIISRTQRFTFKPISKPDLISQLKDIAKKENIEIDDQALELIAEHGDGSFRDSISLLDQLQHAGQKVNTEYISNSLGLAPTSLVNEIMIHLESEDSRALHESLEQARVQGVQPLQLASQLSQSLRQALLDSNTRLSPSRSINLLKQLALLPAHPRPLEGLELLLFDFVFEAHGKDSHQSVPPAEPKPVNITESASKSASSPKAAKTAKSPEQRKDPQPQPEAKPKKINNAPSGSQIEPGSWDSVLEALKSKYNTLYGTIRMANPLFNGNEVVLEFKFPFHQKRLKESRNQKIVIDTVREVTGSVITLSAVVNKSVNPAPAETVLPPDPPLAVGEGNDIEAISNIFDGAEVVE